MPVIGDLLGRVKRKSERSSFGEFRNLGGRGLIAGLSRLPGFLPKRRPIPANAGGGIFQQLLQQDPDQLNRIPVEPAIRQAPEPAQFEQPAIAPEATTEEPQIRDTLAQGGIEPVKPIQPVVSSRPRRRPRFRRTDFVEQRRQREQQRGR